MTHYLGDISHFRRGAGSPGSSGKVGTAIVRHHNENRGGFRTEAHNRYSPSIDGLLNGSTHQSGAGRHWSTAWGCAAVVDQWKQYGVDLLSVAKHPTLPMNHRLTPRQDPRDAEGGAGETMRDKTRGRTIYQQTAHDPALALLAGVVIVAIKDAQRGCNEASGWLAEQGIPENVWRSSRARLAMKS